MRLLLVSKVPHYFEPYRKHNQDFPDFQAQAFWVKALRDLGHKVDVFRYTDSVFLPVKVAGAIERWAFLNIPKVYGKYQLLRNRLYWWFIGNWIRSGKLVKIIKASKYDAILISGGISELVGTELDQAKSQGVPIVLIHGVNPKLLLTGYEKKNISKFDLVIVNDPTHTNNWLALGASKVVALPMSAVDPTVHKKIKLTQKEIKDYGTDVVFVGTLTPERQRILVNLLDNGFKMAIYGLVPPDMGLKSALKKVYKGEAWGERMVKIYNGAKIGLNLVDKSMPLGGNMRTFEIPACGTMQLANRRSTEWYIGGKEVVSFDVAKEAVNKIEYYLSSDKNREKIAQAGYVRTLMEHTYKKRFKKMLSMI